MANLKQIYKRFIFISVLFLCSCTTAPIIIEKPYPVYQPALHDTILLKDTITLSGDSIWVGDVQDSLKNVIGWLKVYYNKKIAELKLNPRIDTVFIPDTLYQDRTNVLQIISGFLPLWAEAVLIAVAFGLLTLANKGSLTNILKGLKK